MLTLENLKEFTKKFQTTSKNVAQEYIQHLFLSNLYKFKEAEKLLFKGGTALKIVYGSPRFSEDLDFTGQNIFRHQEIDELFIATLSEIEKTGVKVSFKEAKPTTGGYLGIISYELFDIFEDMKFEISLRKGKTVSEITTIINDYIPAYTLIHLRSSEIVRGKIEALLQRKKLRDYYDLYFLLRHPELNKFVDKKKLNEVLISLEKEKIDFKKELSVLLPVSHQMILRDFKNILKREIEKYF